MLPSTRALAQPLLSAALLASAALARESDAPAWEAAARLLGAGPGDSSSSALSSSSSSSSSAAGEYPVEGHEEGGHDEGHHTKGHHIVNSVVVIVVVASLCGTVISWICTQLAPKLCSKIPLPYTLAVFLAGFACSATTVLERGGEREASGDGDEEEQSYWQSTHSTFVDVWHHAFSQAQHMNPHIILLVILPPLIYESASDMNYHVFQKVAGKAFFLAFPGMILSLVLTGYWCEYTFGHDWGTSVCMLLGAIVSATDPVAVVAALHELGAPAKLASVIDGESLLNDGSAMVMFIIFLKISSGAEEYDFGEGVVLFLQLALGGFAWGLLVYYAASFVIHHTTDDSKIEISTIVIAVYGNFGIAEIFLKVSGIISVVTFGVFMASRGKYAISPTVESKLHATMGSLSHFSETAIFFVAGVVSYSAIASEGVGSKEVGNLFGLYGILHAIRIFVIHLCFTIMNKLGNAGYQHTWKECAIMTWGGLRGAVGLALGLLVVESAAGDKLTDEDAKLINFYVSGVVILTMAINGTTCVALYKWLGVYETNMFRQKMVSLIVKDIEAEMSEYMTSDEFQGDWLYGKVDPSVLLKLVPKFTDVRVNEGNELTNLPALAPDLQISSIITKTTLQDELRSPSFRASALVARGEQKSNFSGLEEPIRHESPEAQSTCLPWFDMSGEAAVVDTPSLDLESDPGAGQEAPEPAVPSATSPARAFASSSPSSLRKLPSSINTRTVRPQRRDPPIQAGPLRSSSALLR